MVIGTLISIMEKIVGNDGKVSPLSYRGGKSTSRRVYIIPKSLDQHTNLMDKIENELKQNPSTSSLKIDKDVRKNLITLGTFSIFVKPYSNFNPKRVEDKQIQTLFKIFNNLDNSVGSPFKIKIGKKIYEIDLQKNGTNTITKGTRIDGRETKSDIIIKTENSGDIYISLKGNTSHQWSGVSDFVKENDVKNFATNLILKKNKFGWCLKLTDNDLIKKSLYGKEYGSKFGPENVNHIMIGENIEYEQISNKDYAEISSIRTYDNGDIPIQSDFPHIQSSRDSKRNDLGFKNLRITIWRGSKGTTI